MEASRHAGTGFPLRDATNMTAGGGFGRRMNR